MAVDSHHPDYTAFIEDWRLMRHCFEGARTVKRAGQQYLSMPNGFTAQSDQGVSMYDAYVKRAQFRDIVAPTIRGMVGMMHQRPAQIEMPSAMDFLVEKASFDQETLEAFHRRITSEILLTGRYAVLADAPAGGGDPYLVGYAAERLINWSEDRTLFVLDETDWQRQGFEWTMRRQFLVLRLENGRYIAERYTSDTVEGNAVPVTGRGGVVLAEIPLVVIGAVQLIVSPEAPPLIGVGNAAVAMYRLDADYRHQLFMSGQETLFITGVTESGDLPTVVGAGVTIGLPEGGKAEYVGPDGVGIDAHRQAIQDEVAVAASEGARLFDQTTKAAESGEALRLRFGAQTATIKTIAMTSAAGLEKALRNIAMMLGLNPDLVIVKPNLSFLDAVMNPTEAAALVKVWQGGAISYDTLYENLQRGGIASQERDVDEEQELIDAEVPDLALMPPPSQQPGQPPAGQGQPEPSPPEAVA